MTTDGPPPATGGHFVISRVFDAARGGVWRAWTEPARLVAWCGPKGAEPARVIDHDFAAHLRAVRHFHRREEYAARAQGTQTAGIWATRRDRRI
jgi:uncharacterized protein YndB with AHSA1/START domain